MKTENHSEKIYNPENAFEQPELVSILKIRQTIPEQIQTLPQVHTLILNNIQSSILPDWLGQLTTVQKIKFDRGTMHLLTAHNMQVLSQMKSLQHIEILRGPLPVEIADLKQVKKLHIHQWQWKDDLHIPALICESLVQMNSLEYLQIDSGFLPVQVKLLTQLTYLDLSSQPTATVNAILELNQLKSLHLFTCPLSADQVEMLSLFAGLQELTLAKCGLTQFPQPLLSLDSLHYLDLRENKLVSLPSQRQFDTVSELKYLDLQNCELEGFPPGILSLHKLEKLDLSENPQIQILPFSINALSRLQNLNLRKTGLREVPDSIESLTQLEELILSDNSLESVPNLKVLPNLKRTDLYRAFV
ncbi:hypothetical protein QNI19_08410 [Cytophagaceae bacterium DM2B3-1]|uniref:Disease resistance R13L4/SHOC-2-like LRR domain-containing protein n=1 Tax=Xanthocytophaga flava TaxID=3048013 RepID=A0ABT7CHF4_9BACT|nr:leucine-rich repeat domain-containing protein [Xanthocytophaga flavus]MDJ1492951.1 hypothetical protein [Xanthocytophaga flavus]